MSREIKFRAWDHTDKEMVDVSDLIFEPRIYVNGVGSDFEVLQYTGLRDKNGVEIYDHDIVTFKYVSEIVTAVVEYDAPTARWIKRFTSSYGPETKDLVSYASSQKVIGNIYENPELVG